MPNLKAQMDNILMAEGSHLLFMMEHYKVDSRHVLNNSLFHLTQPCNPMDGGDKKFAILSCRNSKIFQLLSERIIDSMTSHTSLSELLPFMLGIHEWNAI